MRVSVVVFTCLFGLSGCVLASSDDDRSPSSGEVVVEWTIDGAADPGECRQGSVDSFDIQIATAGGRLVREYEADCEAFATTIDLNPGDYVANAVLLDGRGDERTTSVPVSEFTIYPDDELHVPVDFPADAFF